MNIKTKADIGDKLFYVINPKREKNQYKYSVEELVVERINVEILKSYTSIYYFPYDEELEENKGVFWSKEEAQTQAQKLSLKLKQELKEERAYERKSKKEEAIKAIKKLVKQGGLKIKLV